MSSTSVCYLNKFISNKAKIINEGCQNLKLITIYIINTEQLNEIFGKQNLFNKFGQTNMKQVLLSVLLNICIIHSKKKYFKAEGNTGKVYLIETEGGL